MYHTWYTTKYFLFYCTCKMQKYVNSTSEKHLEKFLRWKYLVINTTFFIKVKKTKKHYGSVASLTAWHTIDLGSIPEGDMKKKRQHRGYRGLYFWCVLLVSTEKVCFQKNKTLYNFKIIIKSLKRCIFEFLKHYKKFKIL